MAGDFHPENYKDDYRDNLKAMIQAKVDGKEIVETPAPQHLAPVIDILEALKMSLAQGKRPARSSDEPAASESNGGSKKKAGRG